MSTGDEHATNNNFLKTLEYRQRSHFYRTHRTPSTSIKSDFSRIFIISPTHMFINNRVIS